VSNVHELRRRLRAELAAGRRVVGTFVKLATPDVVELAARAGFAFVVVDLEHAVLGEADAVALVRHADAIGLPALVRVPCVDAAMIGRLLENGAAGIQVSMLQRATQTAALRDAARYAPAGRRSVSLANRVAGFGATPLAEYLAAEADAPPLLVGQLETAIDEPWPQLLAGLDVAFVGTTDLAVSVGQSRLAAAIESVREGAAAAGVAFGGWLRNLTTASDLDGAGYLVVGSDLQFLAAGLRAAAPSREAP
jgi:4-hydroxy-2-oxoheptanedioate aldolase